VLRTVFAEHEFVIGEVILASSDASR
jgi:hypothetical protein